MCMYDLYLNTPDPKLLQQTDICIMVLQFTLLGWNCVLKAFIIQTSVPETFHDILQKK